jgi:hypothetical protein
MTFDPAFIFYTTPHVEDGLETLGDMATEAEEEYATRVRLYPGRVQKGRMSRADADRELRVMGALADALTGTRKRGDAPPRGTATWAEIIQCLRTEILKRRETYPAFVAAGHVDQATADRRLRMLESLHDMEWNMTWSREAIAGREATRRLATAA